MDYRETAPPLWRRFLWQPGGHGQRGVHKLRNGPSFIRNAKGLRWRRARLPKSGAEWPEAERKLWLQLLEGSFKLIYTDKVRAIPPPPV